ncbi:MAG TPA: diacylglycerol kinase family protein [Acidimicrobiales bacterium]|nr:diacylglycerol kinase family protein [Acidimicrobiales bacterium]
MKLLLLVNTSASSVTARARVVIQKSLSADHEVTVAETSRRGHATRLAQGAAAKGTDAVIVLGGDGTLNEAANGLAHTDCALGVLPGGSTNVFARTIGMTNDPIEATGELLSALGPGSAGIRPVGLGNVNGRRYLFHVGVGFDAAVVAQVERRSTLKRYLGHAFFAYAAVDTWARHYDRRKPHFSISLHRRNGEEINVSDGYLALVLNTNPYTFLGERPFDVAPGTGLDTPLAALVVRSLGAVTMLGLVGSALRRDRGIGNHRKAALATEVVRATVKPRTTVPYQVDGDYLGQADRLEFTWEPESLRLIVPHPPEAES